MTIPHAVRFRPPDKVKAGIGVKGNWRRGIKRRVVKKGEQVYAKRQSGEGKRADRKGERERCGQGVF